MITGVFAVGGAAAGNTARFAYTLQAAHRPRPALASFISPITVERIACWGREVIEGRFRLTELFEMPFFRNGARCF